MSKKITPYKDSSLSKKEQIAKMFDTKITYLKPRSGERYASALTKISNNHKIINKYGKIDLKDYVTSFIKSEKL